MLELKGGFCKDCRERNLSEESDRKVRRASLDSAGVQEVLLTTENAIALGEVERLGIVSAECAFGINVFKDLFAGVRDIVGGRSEAIQQVMRQSKKTVLSELKIEAYELGADAVVGVQFQYVELSTAGSMILLVANGTAVKRYK